MSQVRSVPHDRPPDSPLSPGAGEPEPNIADLGNSTAKAIDRVHLSRQTLGDIGLERDLLALFADRAAEILHKLMVTAGTAERRDLAHALKGSALAIGAHRIVRAAALYEDALYKGNAGQAVSAALGQLKCAVAAARAEIAAES